MRRIKWAEEETRGELHVHDAEEGKVFDGRQRSE